MRHRSIITAVAAALLVSAFAVGPAVAATATVTTDQTAFTTATGATPIAWPSDANTALTLHPWAYNDYSCTTGSISLAGGQVTVARASGGTHLCFLGTGWNAGLANTNPTPTGPTIVVSGEDDYTVTIAFVQPVVAVGFGLLTNSTASETVTLSFLDGTTQVIADAQLGTAANQFEFIGFTSDNPITGVLLNTTGGAAQNEGITGIWTAAAGACYAASGSIDFLPPFDDSTPSNLIVNKMKNGRVVPVKVTLFNQCTQLPVDSTANVTIVVTRVPVSSGTPADPVEVYADAGLSNASTDAFRWSPDGFWIYNLDSKALGLTSGSTYRIDVYVEGVKVTVANWALLAPVK